MNLPIDVIPGTTPPKFRWRQTITVPNGPPRTQEYEGVLPPSLEPAVEALVMIAKQLDSEVVVLTVENVLLKKRVGELEKLVAEPPGMTIGPITAHPKPPPTAPIKK